LVRAFAGNITEEQIRAEARTIEELGKRSHDNIIRIFDHGRFSSISPMYFIDMELCEIDLEAYISNKRRGIRGLVDWDIAFSEGQREFLIIAILQQLLAGLAFIHGHDMVHRDIAPQNGIACT
jgi:serine/threonine protein kinase